MRNFWSLTGNWSFKSWRTHLISSSSNFPFPETDSAALRMTSWKKSVIDLLNCLTGHVFLIKPFLRLVDLSDDRSSLPWSGDLIKSSQYPYSSLSSDDPSKNAVGDFISSSKANSVVMGAWEGFSQLPSWKRTFYDKFHTAQERSVQGLLASLWSNE